MNRPAELDLVAAQAARLDSLLVSLRGELDTAANPNRAALRRLGVNAEGWTARAYDDAAFGSWSRLLALDPQDTDSRHHLAIMHHARAIDLEQGARPDASDRDWTAALAHWTALWRSDRFWDRLAAVVCPPAANGQRKRGVVDALRERFPTLLLRLHFDIALDPATPHHRARYHVGLALGAELPAAAKFEARRASYEKLAAAIPDQAWDEAALDEAAIGDGLAAVRTYLNIDPEGTTALLDALRLQHRLMRVQINQLNAADDGPSAEREQLLNRMRQDVQAWGPCFANLAGAVASLDDFARHELCQWYRIAGDVYCALEQPQEAIAFYEQGAAVGPEQDEERVRCARELPQTQASIARRMAQRGEDGALACANRVRARPDLTVLALQQLGNAFLLLDQLETAEAVCAQGLALEASGFGDAAQEQDELARERLHELARYIAQLRAQRRAHDRYLEAGTLFREARHAEAAAALDECIALAPDSNAFHYLQARCQVALLEVGRARKALREYRRTMADSDEDRDFEKLVEGELGECEAQIERMGRDSLALQREAARRLAKEEHDTAVALLRRAVACCRRAGRKEPEAALAAALVGWAVADANAAVADESLDPGPRLERLRSCRGRLSEACRLDSGNEHARNNLGALDSAIDNLRPDAELAATIGDDAFKAYGRARRRLQAHEPGGGRPEFGAALQRCSAAGRAALQHQWAEALTSDAVAAVNAVQQDAAKANADRLDVYRRALQQLQEARTQEPDSKRVQENLATLLDILVTSLRSEAALAYNHKTYSVAEMFLREALKDCPAAQRKAVAGELSIVLANRAVADVNELVTRRPISMLARRF